MALKGTIKDFGIADIFQLIGHQTKTGVLILRDEVDEVRVYFYNGAVVRADSTTRPKNMLLGSMLLNAELLSREDLERALKEQERTLKKIGAVLIESGKVDENMVREYARLQMTETVFRLFTWQSGTYEFEQTDVPQQTEGVEPIRAETILMEGLRMIDEWPIIRRRLPSYTVIPERLKPLPDPPRQEDELDLDVFGFEGTDHKASPKTGADIGPNERRIYGLIKSGRDVQKLIHLSRLGEFETCRSLLNLVSSGYVSLVETPMETMDVGQPKSTSWPSKVKLGGFGLRIATYVLIGAIALVMLRAFDGEQIGLAWGRTLRYKPEPTQLYLAQSQMQVIDRALHVYRLEHGSYPASLEDLTVESLLRERDLRFPFEDRYFYKVEGDRYVLLPPLR